MMHYHMNFEIESKKQYLNLIMMRYRPTCERDWLRSRTVVELDWLSNRHFQVRLSHWSIRQSKLRNRSFSTVHRGRNAERRAYSIVVKMMVSRILPFRDRWVNVEVKYDVEISSSFYLLGE